MRSVHGDFQGAGAWCSATHFFEAGFGEFVFEAVVDGGVFAEG